MNWSILGEFSTFFLRHPIRNSTIALFVLWMVGIRIYRVSTLDEQHAWVSSTIESFSDILHGQTAADLAMAHHFAVLSAAAYGDDQAWKVTNCAYQAVLAQWTPLPLPNSVPTKPTESRGSQARWDSKLELRVWYREQPSHVDVVIAFRGTDGAGDFYSNLHWLTRFLAGWDQYDLTRTIAPFIEQYAAAKFPDRDIRMIATGHSLGGGLAQQAGYASSTIKLVYAFDSSSVTGYYDVDRATRDRAKIGMRIYRLNERGEVLQYLRGFMSWLYPVKQANPQIVQVTYNSDTGSAIGQHSIQKLACALIRANGTVNVVENVALEASQP